MKIAYDLEDTREMTIQNDIEKYKMGEKEIPPEITSTPLDSIDEMNEERREELENYLKTS